MVAAMVPTNCNANGKVASDASSVKEALVSAVTVNTSACETGMTRTLASFLLVSSFLAVTER